MTTAAALKRHIAIAAGREPADLVIKNTRVLNLITGALEAGDVAISGERIVGVQGSYQGTTEIDGTGKVCVPGFIDTHLHIESSLVTPQEFDRCVLPHGVTTCICDPHEIANVIGAEGIRYFLTSAETTVMDIRVNLSSCVPATPFETAGAALFAADLVPLMDHPKVIGLAEMMNFPGVINGDDVCIDKLAAFQDRHIDGHAPLVRGTDLNAYLAAGIRTDHETTSADEAWEKLSKGMTVLIREGSVSKDMHALAEILTADTSAFVALCTDDRNPLDIAEQGHLDYMIRTLIALGRPLHHVYRAASWSAARAFGLKDRGLVAPGWRADIVLVDDLSTCAVNQVIAAGRPVNADRFAARPAIAPVGLGSVKATPLTADAFLTPPFKGPTPVIAVDPGKIITRREDHILTATDSDHAAPDLARDIVHLAVVARHGKNDNIGRGFVTGFGLKQGAIASSVGHDSHNICVIGANRADMATAVNRLIALGGGFVIAAGGAVTGELALPVAGLMSDQPHETVRALLGPLRAAAYALGCVLEEPFLQIAFLPLPVIPHLKITDHGLFNVDSFSMIQP